jgi:hypothetical protein
MPINLLWAADPVNGCLDCVTPKTSENTFNLLCKNVDDIVCKTVPDSQRRSCNEEDKDLFSFKNMNRNQIYQFTAGCFKSSITSFSEFFTDLMKGIWSATKSVSELTVNSFSKNDEVGIWGKLKGAYESSSSVAADIFEAAKSDPGAYLEQIMNKIAVIIPSIIDNFTCFNPQLKVEKSCAFITEFLMPPAFLASVLVLGFKGLKVIKNARLLKEIEATNNVTKLTLKQYQKHFDQLKALGYSETDIDKIYTTGKLESLDLNAIKPLSTKDGLAQRLSLIDVKTDPAIQIKKPIVKSKAYVPLNLTKDDITFVGLNPKGEAFLLEAKILERILEDGKEIAYRVQYIDPKTKEVTVKKLTNNMMANAKVRVNPKPSNVGIIRESDDPYSEFLRLEKEANQLVKLKKIQEENEQSSLFQEFMDLQNSKTLKPNIQYENSINFTNEDGFEKYKIIKTKTIPKEQTSLDTKTIASPGLISEQFSSNYLTISAKDTMGNTGRMKAEITKTFKDRGEEFVIINIMDPTSQSMIPHTLSIAEFKRMRPKESPESEKLIIQFKKTNGIQPIDLEH